ncbi:MAG: hypothetical protein Ct9H300mP14_00010 [Gammaproteobacteria bacterium]|nr:MAG: hypothetical protein Ct9H300mP14_00010 [Gammaproteobacteria bacterium]
MSTAVKPEFSDFEVADLSLAAGAEKKYLSPKPKCPG